MPHRLVGAEHELITALAVGLRLKHVHQVCRDGDNPLAVLGLRLDDALPADQLVYIVGNVRDRIFHLKRPMQRVELPNMECCKADRSRLAA